MNNRAMQVSGADDDVRVRLSCLMDGEADGSELQSCLDALRSSEAARVDWSMWHAAGDALRSSEVACWHSEGFSARMARALEDEPAIVAPRPSPTNRLMRRVVLPGAAVAAAAAMLTVVALPVLRGTAEGPSSGPTVELASRPAKAASQEPATVVRVERLPQMDAYIAAHREMTGGVVGRPGTTPYLRTNTVVPER